MATLLLDREGQLHTEDPFLRPTGKPPLQAIWPLSVLKTLFNFKGLAARKDPLAQGFVRNSAQGAWAPAPTRLCGLRVAALLLWASSVNRAWAREWGWGGKYKILKHKHSGLSKNTKGAFSRRG